MIRDLCASDLTESADGDFVGLGKIGSENFEYANCILCINSIVRFPTLFFLPPAPVAAYLVGDSFRFPHFL